MGSLQVRTVAPMVTLMVFLAHGAEAGKRRQPTQTPERPVENPLPGNALFDRGEASATFRLSQVGKDGKPSPERELLFSTTNQQAIAALLKDERNKALQPGLIPPDDANAKGIKVRFDGIRFLRIPDEPDLARVRLVGPVNEVECKRPLSISKLTQSVEPISVQFQSVTRTSGVTVTITTDMKLLWDDGNLAVRDTHGSIDFSVGRFSPARLFYASDLDRVKLPNLVGKRVSEDAMVRRSLLEPEKL